MSSICDGNKPCINATEEKSSDSEEFIGAKIDTQSIIASEKVIKNSKHKNHYINIDDNVQCNVTLPDGREFKCELKKKGLIAELLCMVRLNYGYSKYDRFEVFYSSRANNKTWISQDERIEKKVIITDLYPSGPWNFKLRLVAAIYLWNPKFRLALNPLERVGHLSLKLYDNTYISHWPQELWLKWNKEGKQHITLDDDIKAENGDPSDVFYLESVRFYVSRQNMIKDWWKENKTKWNLINNNCAQKVHNALMICSFFTERKLIRPTSVFNYVKHAVKKCHNLREKYIKEYEDVNLILLNELKNKGFRKLDEMDESEHLVESIKLIKQLKASYSVIHEHLRTLAINRHYFEKDLWKRKIDANLKKTNKYRRDKREYTYQLVRSIFDINELNIKPLKFQYKLVKQIRKESQKNLDLIRMNEILLENREMNSEENVKIREKYAKFIKKYDLKAYRVDLKEINLKFEKNSFKTFNLHNQIKKIIEKIELNDNQIAITENLIKCFHERIDKNENLDVGEKNMYMQRICEYTQYINDRKDQDNQHKDNAQLCNNLKRLYNDLVEFNNPSLLSHCSFSYLFNSFWNEELEKNNKSN